MACGCRGGKVRNVSPVRSDDAGLKPYKVVDGTETYEYATLVLARRHVAALGGEILPNTPEA